MIDSTYVVFVLPAIIISMIAQSRIQSVYRKNLQIISRREYTGAQVARMILQNFGLGNVKVEECAGELSDHFNPKTNTVHLSKANYAGVSLSSIGVSAHEVGHAIQYAQNYAPIKIRNSILPVVNFATTVSVPLAVLGILLSVSALANFGILLFGAVVLFQLITLPIEFNASRRAVKILSEYNILDEDEIKKASGVLKAAACTYLAAALVSVANLTRLIALKKNRR